MTLNEIPVVTQIVATAGGGGRVRIRGLKKNSYHPKKKERKIFYK